MTMKETQNIHTFSSPEDSLQESIPRNTETQEDIQIYGENLRSKQEPGRVMESIETYASRNPDTCLNFASSKMTQYFQILQER